MDASTSTADRAVPTVVPTAVSTGASAPSPARTLLGRLAGPTRTTATLRTIAAVATVLFLYFGVWGSTFHAVDANPDFVPPNAVEGGSHAINMAAGLVDREVNVHRWSANGPWFAPDAFLDNGPNFQQGIMHAIARFSFEALDHLARARGSSRADPDLERAAGFLQYPGDVWLIDLTRSWLPMVPSEEQYRVGLQALLAYNTRLAEGRAVFEKRADALAATLQRVSADLGSQSALLDAHVRKRNWWPFDTEADDVFYRNKGIAYAYYMLLRELGRDVEPVIEARGVGYVWNQTLATLRYASQLQPLVVLNSAGDDSIFANHLVLQGFYLKRAVLQLNELVKVLTV